jgi:glycosyltransferase involved in cell wall biosynthesis
MLRFKEDNSVRILLSSNHPYPASRSSGSGTNPKEFPSGAGFVIHDLVAKGLAEAGHEVFYLLPRGAEAPLPSGVTLLREPRFDVDVIHTITMRDHALARHARQAGIPWVATCHHDPTHDPTWGGRLIPEEIQDNWIFVSRTLAHSVGRHRYVVNGIDPEQYLFCETPEEYCLFMANLESAAEKGLDIALHLATRHHLRLIVAGTATTHQVIEEVARQCQAAGAELVGDVRGITKARLLAHARALLFPTQVNEGFGLAMAEALVSGTPVIASSNGACPEIVTPEVGFICRSEHDYDEALGHVDEIARRSCRERAIQHFHYQRMAADYLREYRAEIALCQEAAYCSRLNPVRGQMQ